MACLRLKWERKFSLKIVTDFMNNPITHIDTRSFLVNFYFKQFRVLIRFLWKFDKQARTNYAFFIKYPNVIHAQSPKPHHGVESLKPHNKSWKP